MKYRMADSVQNKAARNRLYYLASKKRVVEIKEIRPKRTLAQNSYLHLIVAYFGVHFGYSLEEAKQLYKELNRDIYFYKKKKRTFIRSSADLNKEEMARSIDNFMLKSAEAGCPLPLATDQDWLLEIENEIERSRYR
jgi:hypothetical protein